MPQLAESRQCVVGWQAGGAAPAGVSPGSPPGSSRGSRRRTGPANPVSGAVSAGRCGRHLSGFLSKNEEKTEEML